MIVGGAASDEPRPCQRATARPRDTRAEARPAMVGRVELATKHMAQLAALQNLTLGSGCIMTRTARGPLPSHNLWDLSTLSVPLGTPSATPSIRTVCVSVKQSVKLQGQTHTLLRFGEQGVERTAGSAAIRWCTALHSYACAFCAMIVIWDHRLLQVEKDYSNFFESH